MARHHHERKGPKGRKGKGAIAMRTERMMRMAHRMEMDAASDMPMKRTEKHGSK